MKHSILYTVGLIGFACTTTANAVEFEFAGMDARLTSSFSLGAALRLEDQDVRLIGFGNQTSDGRQGQGYSTNIDDGNLAFDKGDLVSGAAKLTSELNIGRGDWGVLVSGNYVYDAVLNDHDFLSEANYAGAPTHSLDANDLKRRRNNLHDRVGNDGDILDAYLYGGFNLGDNWISLRVGKQVINWGESTFVLNGINSFLSVDASQVRVPGVKLSEVFLPAGMAWLSASLSENISFEAFYQYEWVATEPDPAGSFFSSSDFAGYGGESLEIAFGRCPEHINPIPLGGNCTAAPGGTTTLRAADRRPDDGGQGGFALRGFLDQWGGVDWGLYAVNYHSRLPLASGTGTLAGFEAFPSTANYFLEYPEDIKLYGVSFNTLLPIMDGIALQGEYSLKQDQPLQLDGVEVVLAAMRVPIPTQLGPFAPSEYIRGWRRHDVHQLDMSVSKILGPGMLGQSQTVLVFEMAGMQVENLPDASQLAYEAPGTDTPSNPLTVALLNASADATVLATGLPAPQPIVTNTNPYAEEFSWGYRVAARLNYANLLPGFEILPTAYFAHDVEGTSPSPIANFIEGRKEIRLSLDAIYLFNTSFRIGYTKYYGAAARNVIRDRDNLSVSFEYSF